ncbi:MAG TPA: hypothetical protein VEX64_01805, partial [Pyrinomonadaceae bacterium]|nr:hypothetical protein [Pyrinomonadaceae bacterium]
MKKLLFASLATVLCLLSFEQAHAQGSYQKPSKDVMDALNAPAIPSTSISPSRDRILIAEPLRYPPISELAQPMLRLAGLRINPNANSQHRQPYFVKLSLKSIADGKDTSINLPPGAQIISPQWSADGRYIAAGNLTPTGVELWIIETATGRANKIKNAQVNTAFGGFSWMPDQRSLLVNLVPAKRGAAPGYQNLTPGEPSIQETSGKSGAVQTFQDLLKNPHDERLFDYYAASQLAVISVDGKIRNVGQPGIFDTSDVAPDGQHLLVARLQKPYSYLYPSNRFPREVEVWNLDGKMIYKLASLPLQDQIPVEGVPTGARAFGWHPVEPATLVWAEALDNGDPRTKITPRDRVLSIKAPFSGQPVELVKTEHRYSGRQFGERDGLMLVFDYNRDTRRRRIFAMNFNNPSQQPQLVSDLNIADRYNDPGTPVTKTLPTGKNVIRQNGDDVFMTSAGATPQGERPFLRRMNLKTKETKEIFRSNNESYESFVALMDDNGTKFITRKESISEPPNLFLNDGSNKRALTSFPDPV